MNSWSYISAPTFKLAELHQSATALALLGNASATNVGVVTIG